MVLAEAEAGAAVLEACDSSCKHYSHAGPLSGPIQILVVSPGDKFSIVTTKPVTAALEVTTRGEGSVHSEHVQDEVQQAV